jgi:photosystem II stability/assembly factor-like uncharacterized protein
MLAVALLAGTHGTARAECAEPVPDSEWSVLMPLAAESLMLDIARVGDTVVVAGDRGHILISDDQGRNWTQKRTPTRALLTGIWFHDRDLGWAVGHDAVILRTEDGGDTWCRVHWEPELERPLFDVWFENDRSGFAVGAYGYFLRSDDGGLSWREEVLEVAGQAPGQEDDEAPADGDDEQDPDAEGEWDEWSDDSDGAADLHLNRIIPADGGRLYLMAEAGTVFRSDDHGSSWVRLDPPYDGSFFHGIGLGKGSILVYGLRGNMFRSWDEGASWQKIRLPVDSSLFGGGHYGDGGVLVVGAAGVMLVSREGDRFRLVQRPDRKALVGALPLDDGAVILIGEPGVQRLERGVLAAE